MALRVNIIKVRHDFTLGVAIKATVLALIHPPISSSAFLIRRLPGAGSIQS